MPQLIVSDLNVRHGRVIGTQDVSFAVEEGEIFALVGSNGAGKSSAIKAILGMAHYSSGKITFEGEDLSGLKTSEIVRRGIALSPEGRRVFPQLTVEENLRMGAFTRTRDESQERMQQIYRYFPRLKERAKQHASSLSGGEQQMLAIARALMGRPSILLLDEPSLGLAPKIVEEIFAIIGQIKADGTGVLLVEQNAALALDVAEYGFVLELGEITLKGSAEVLKESPIVRASYL